MRHIMRSIALGSALCLGLTTGSTLFAQDSTGTATQEGPGGHFGPHGPMSPDQELGHLTKALSLSSDQQTQIKPILQDRHDQLMQLHQDGSLSRDEKRSKMKSLDDDSNTKLEAVLKPDQKTKYEKMVADREEHMREHRNGGGDPDQAQPQ